MCPRDRRSDAGCGSSEADVVGGVRQELLQLNLQSGVGLPVFKVSHKLLPGQRFRPPGKRDELGNRPAAHGHPQPLPRFDPPQDSAHVVSKVPSRNVAHVGIVAFLLRLLGYRGVSFGVKMWSPWRPDRMIVRPRARGDHGTRSLAATSGTRLPCTITENATTTKTTL